MKQFFERRGDKIDLDAREDLELLVAASQSGRT